MKIKQILSLSALAFGTVSFAAGDHGDEAKPRHGGVVSVAKDVSYELVAAKQALSLYVRDHGKPMDLAGASAKLILLSGSDKQEVDLKPEGGLFQASGSFVIAPGTKALARVKLRNNPVQSVRFALN